MNTPPSSAGTRLNLLAATSACRREVASEIKYIKMGSLDVRLSCHPIEKTLQVEPLYANIKKRKGVSAVNAYCQVLVEGLPTIRIFTAGGPVVRMFDVTSQNRIFEFAGHTSTLTAVIAQRINDSNLLFTSSLDKTARMWNIATGQTLRVFDGHKDAVMALFVSVEMPSTRKLLDEEVIRAGKARMKLQVGYRQNEDLEFNLDVTILELEDMPLPVQKIGLITYHPDIRLAVQVHPTHEVVCQIPTYDTGTHTWSLYTCRDKQVNKRSKHTGGFGVAEEDGGANEKGGKGTLERTYHTHVFRDVDDNNQLEISIISGEGRNETVLGLVSEKVGDIRTRIYTEVGLDADEITSYYTIDFARKARAAGGGWISLQAYKGWARDWLI